MQEYFPENPVRFLSENGGEEDCHPIRCSLNVDRFLVAIVNLHHFALCISSRSGSIQGFLGRECSLKGCSKRVALQKCERFDEIVTRLCVNMEL